jgi:predicted peptidase
MDARAPKSLKTVKIWWFMGTEDREELVIPAKKRAEACKKADVDITYTEIKGGDHSSSWETAYGNPKVWDWVFAQKSVAPIRIQGSPSKPPSFDTGA